MATEMTLRETVVVGVLGDADPAWRPAAEAYADAFLEAVPDGWARLGGEWVRLRPRTPDDSAGRRLYEEV